MPSTRTRAGASARFAITDEPTAQAVALAQRGRMILDIAAADLEMAEKRLGAFHETTWFFREALNEARRAWDRLRADLGGALLDAAGRSLPREVLSVGDDGRGHPRATFVPIFGKTYRAERVRGSPLAPVLWRLTALRDSDDGPYYLSRLRDGSTRCDCAEWVYQVADVADAPPCKHLEALGALGWI